MVAECLFLETEDHIEVSGVAFHKPFVEKPVSAEDHNVYIYFPTSAGGGSQRLFRKVSTSMALYSVAIHSCTTTFCIFYGVSVSFIQPASAPYKNTASNG